MTHVPPSDSTSHSQSNLASLQAAEDDNITPLSDEIICDDHDEKGHTQYTCLKCRESLNSQFDDLLRGVMLQDEVNAVGSLRQFAKKSMAELVPDPTEPEEVQRRVWGYNCVQELQARIDATREIHEARTRK
jgi:hypothetical protein